MEVAGPKISVEAPRMDKLTPDQFLADDADPSQPLPDGLASLRMVSLEVLFPLGQRVSTPGGGVGGLAA